MLRGTRKATDLASNTGRDKLGESVESGWEDFGMVAGRRVGQVGGGLPNTGIAVPDPVPVASQATDPFTFASLSLSMKPATLAWPRH